MRHTGIAIKISPQILYELRAELRDLDVKRIGQLLPNTAICVRRRSRSIGGVSFNDQDFPVKSGILAQKPRRRRAEHCAANNDHIIEAALWRRVIFYYRNSLFIN